MKFSFEDHGTTTVLTVSGELTHDEADGFRRACSDRFASGVRNLVLNMEHLRLVDSAGLEVLLWLRDEATSQRVQLRLARLDSTLRKILEITRLDSRFEAHDTLEGAAKSLR